MSSFSSRFLGILTVALLGVAGQVFGSETAIQGTVKDANGKVMANADIKIELSGGSAWSKHTRTDAQGRYYSGGLTSGNNYRVSLIVGGAVKASINNVRTHTGQPNSLDFDLKNNSQSAANAAQGKKKSHMVYIPPETGSNMGGRWVEVDDNTDLSTQQTMNAKRTSAAALGRMQGGSSSASPGGGQ